MQWIGVVTRVSPEGRPYVRCRTLMGESEIGPLLSAQPHVSVEGPGLQAGGDPVTGSAPVVTRYLSGDTVLLCDVQGQLSTYVVLARLV